MNININDTSSFEDLVRIINSLTLKINKIEKKLNILEESYSKIDYFSINHNHEVIFDESIYKSFSNNPPKVTRQNAFLINL